MKTVTVRDLRYDFRKVEGLLRQGRELRVSKRGRIIARLAPEPAAAKVLPDFLGRLETIYKGSRMAVSGAEIVREDRSR